MLDTARAHHRNPVGELSGLGQVVGDEQRGEPDLAADARERLVGLAARYGVECAEGLIDEYCLLTGCERPGDGGSLALPARQLARQPAAEAVRLEPHPREGGGGGGLGIRVAGEPGDERNVAEDRPVGEHAPVLRDVPDAPAEGDGVCMPHVVAADPQRAGVGLDEAVEGAEERGLA